MMQSIVRCLAVIFCAGIAASASAQTGDWPNQPVRMTVPFPAGGPADILARFVSEKLSATWKQPVIIENKPGANTAVAAQQVARMAPNGYNLFVVMDVTMVLNPLLM